MRLQFQTLVACSVIFIFLPAIFLLASTVAPGQTSMTPATTPAGNLSLIQIAAQSLGAGDLPKAEQALSSILETSPEDFRALNLLGIVRAEQHREPDAEKLFKRALDLKPDFTSAHVSLGMLYVQMSKPEEAIPQFQEALRLDPTRSDARSSLVNVLRDQAHAAVRQNDPEKALSFLLQARKASPKDPDVLYDFGIVALKMSLFPDAVGALKEALNLPKNDLPKHDLRKDDANTLYALGRAQMGMANYEDARATFDHYCQLHPSDASGHYALGMTLEALQRPTDAESQFKKSIELQPAQTESYFELGRIELEAGNLQAAEDHFSRVLKRDPHHAGALAGEGRLKFQQKDYAQALDLLSQSIAANASLREAHYYLGITYARMSRREDSDKELAIATRLEHEEVEQHQYLIRIIDANQVPAIDQK
jgi:tetratricopeptide (TPR) repeat protein